MHSHEHLLVVIIIIIIRQNGCLFRMMVALEGLWRGDCLLDPVVLGQSVANVAEAHFRVYVIYCSNAIYQNRKLTELLLVLLLSLLLTFISEITVTDLCKCKCSVMMHGIKLILQNSILNY